MSRLEPTNALTYCTEIDPWEFDPEKAHQYVFLRDRDTKEELPFDFKQPVAAEYQRKLAKINATNAQFEILYHPWLPWDQCCDEDKWRQLRPVHFARFTDDVDHHGRIYTGKYGHQALRKVERRTIHFVTQPPVLEPSVELDYVAMHARLAYHLAGIDYRDDPYALWGPNTTPPMRLMAKIMLNAALNAKDSNAAIADCNRKMSSWTKDKDDKRRRKQGKELDDAIRLYDASQQTGLTFKNIYALALAKHHRIADQFCSDAGLRLMRVDSEIALNVMHHFARRRIPCLGVHDSFIVPRFAKTELREVMRRVYRRRTQFAPVIRGN